MKTYQIELQRLKAASHAHGLINLQIDAVVQPRQNSDDALPTSVLSLTEDNARVLMSLLKAQISELDKRKARSRF